MLTTVFSKSLLDRWRGGHHRRQPCRAAVRDGGLPRPRHQHLHRPARSLQSLIGIRGRRRRVPGHISIYNSYGAMALGGLAIAMGAGYIAGEERGTSGCFWQPEEPHRRLVSKTAALLLIIGLGGVVPWGAGALAPAARRQHRRPTGRRGHPCIW